jgi:hypothetical protein
VRESPGSPSQISARLAPRPAATCWSSATADALSLPPTNQRTNGAFDASSTCDQGFIHGSSAATRAQKVSGSSIDSRYIRW